MTTRVLGHDEYGRLAHVGTGLASIRHDLPESVRVVVVEDGDQIVGCVALLPVWHAEELWIDPAHRGLSAVARRLRAGVAQVARRFVCGASSPENAALYRKHFGASEAPPQYLVTVEGEG